MRAKCRRATCSSSKSPTISQTNFFKSRENTGKVSMSFSFGTLATADHYQTVDITITNEAERLIQALSKYALGAATHPLILLSFDEEKPKPTYLTRLRPALRALIRHSVFPFFLSTTGKVYQFTLSPKKIPPTAAKKGVCVSSSLILILVLTDLH